jgi:hypothetical protein
VGATRYAGLIGGPALWAVNTQAGQILPYSDCATHLRLSASLSFALALLVLGTAVTSWRARALPPPDFASARTQRFVAVLGCLTALVFAFALLLQAAAGIALTGCER